MKPRAGFWSMLAVLACGSGVAAAHEDGEFHLEGATFCVDPASVQVALDLPSPERTASAQKILKRDLLEMIEAALDRGGVAYEVRDRCTGTSDYTLLVADIRYLDPRNYVGFGEGAHNYSLSLQVGGYTDAPSTQLLEQLPTINYRAYLGEIYAEGNEGRPFEPFVVNEGSKLMHGLVAYWQEDNPRRNLRSSLLSPLLGGTMAVLTVLTLSRMLRRKDVNRRDV